MNETKLRKLFADQCKHCGPVIIGRLNDGRLGISDVNIMAFIGDKSIAIESRTVFPKIPEIGQSFSFRGDNETPGVKDFQGFVDGIVNDHNLKKFKATSWKYKDWVMLEADDGDRLFIQQCYLDLLPNKGKFYPNEWKFYAPGPERPVVVKNEEEVSMIIMPMRVRADGIEPQKALPIIEEEAA